MNYMWPEGFWMICGRGNMGTQEVEEMAVGMIESLVVDRKDRVWWRVVGG